MAGIHFYLYGLAAGFSSDAINLGSLGFAASAKASYADFIRLRERGDIRPGVRMQVSLPTPFMIAFCFTAPTSMLDLWPAFERAMQRELAEIARSIPHADVAIQWDISPEVIAILEQQIPEVANLISREQILQGAARITDAVPRDIEVGWHFCYGDAGPSTNEVETKHPIEPRDLRILVDFANDLCAATQRPVNWVHMPVPRARDDRAYFAPLKDLRLKPGMQLFLGLVHRYDGLEGARRRISAARDFYSSFGVGTECGMGRRAPSDIPALLELHHDIAGVLRTIWPIQGQL